MVVDAFAGVEAVSYVAELGSPSKRERIARVAGVGGGLGADRGGEGE